MGYQRVIPRDLFNESKLLKCLGQLALLLHDGKDIRWPLRLSHDNPESGFEIEQDMSSGGLYCLNLNLYLNDREVELQTVMNSKQPYPLLFLKWGEGEEHAGDGEVFNDDGSLADEFKQWLDSVTEEASCKNTGK